MRSRGFQIWQQTCCGAPDSARAGTGRFGVELARRRHGAAAFRRRRRPVRRRAAPWDRRRRPGGRRRPLPRDRHRRVRRAGAPRGRMPDDSHGGRLLGHARPPGLDRGSRGDGHHGAGGRGHDRPERRRRVARAVRASRCPADGRSARLPRSAPVPPRALDDAGAAGRACSSGACAVPGAHGAACPSGCPGAGDDAAGEESPPAESAGASASAHTTSRTRSAAGLGADCAAFGAGRSGTFVQSTHHHPHGSAGQGPPATSDGDEPGPGSVAEGQSAACRAAGSALRVAGRLPPLGRLRRLRRRPGRGSGGRRGEIPRPGGPEAWPYHCSGCAST
jgi:hypothetical protein